MDEDVKRMLADLGVGRRDVVSAPNADARGREMKDDPRLTAFVRQEEAARKEKLATAAASSNEKAQMIHRWNSLNESTGNIDHKGLEDRFGGQAHRVLLAKRLNPSADPWEAVDARVGEERRMYLQQKGNGPNNKPLLPPQPKSGQQNNTRQSKTFAQDRGRTQHSHKAPPNPKRAISPRAYGTIRFPPAGKQMNAQSIQKPALPVGRTEKASAAVSATSSKPHIPNHLNLANSLNVSTAGNTANTANGAKTVTTVNMANVAKWANMANGANTSKTVNIADMSRSANTVNASKIASLTNSANTVNTASMITGSHGGPASAKQNGTSNSSCEKQLLALDTQTKPFETTTKNMENVEPTKNTDFGNSYGTLSASFFNTAGEFMGIHQIAIAAPVHATMSIFSLASQYDVHEFIDALRDMAHQMNLKKPKHSSGVRGLRGARLGPGGIWDDDVFSDGDLF